MIHDKEGIIVGYHEIPVDETILNKLQAFGIDKEEARRLIQKNKHDHTTTTYYLLL